MRPRYRAYHSSARGPGGGLAAAGGLAYGVGGLALAAAAVAAAAVAYSSMAQRQRRRIGLSRAQWEAAVDDAGALVGFDALVSEIAQRGLEPEARADVWPFLLGVFSPDSTFAERRLQHALMVQQHQQLLLQCQALEAALRDCARADGDAGAPPGTPSPPPAAHLPAAAAAAMAQAQQSPRGGGGGGAAAGLPPPELPAQVVAFAEAHRIIVIDAVRTDFRRASVAAVYASDAPAAAAAPAATGPAPPGADDRPGPPPGAGSTLLGPAAPADPLLASWVSGWLSCHPGGVWGPVQRLWVSEAAAAVLEGSAHLAPEGRRQAARLIALLSAYAVYDPETGYCQGMSDLALPMLVLFDDDALAFWCFAALMRTFGARSNFAVDESGIFSQLRGLAGVLGRADRVLAHKLTALGAGECHFAYRMVVVLMRRDLPLGQAMTLWELMWADARRQLAARRRRRAARDAAAPPLIAAAADEEEDPKAALKRRDAAGAGAGGAPPSAGGAAGPGDDADFLSTAASGFFVHFVAAVVVGARRRVLDECRDADDAMRLFHTLKGIDLWECVTRATVLRAAGAGRKQR